MGGEVASVRKQCQMNIHLDIYIMAHLYTHTHTQVRKQCNESTHDLELGYEQKLSQEATYLEQVEQICITIIDTIILNIHTNDAY
jgi:hypothetical protein